MPLFKKINKAQKRPVVLIAPLDWGLGHATRCIPLIKEFVQKDCEVIIAGSGQQKRLLQEEFPALRFAELPGYNVTYSRSGFLTVLKLVFRAPAILAAIRRENRWLREFLRMNQVDLVISDNRFGIYSARVPSVFITHQLLIKTSLGSFADRQLQKLNYALINRFSRCWVPDFEAENNLAGLLSHPVHYPRIPVQYIGTLSRLQAGGSGMPFSEILIILSGPEPSRTQLEVLLINQLAKSKRKTILVRGLPGNSKYRGPMPDHVQVINYATSHMLNRLVNGSKLIICRSGYSSVMDLLPLGRKCVFIPTPGQPEQVYLAEYLKSKHYCLAYPQNRFSLQTALEDAEAFTPTAFAANEIDAYKSAINDVLQSI